MELIQKWLKKHQRRQDKFVSLYEMMFEGCDGPYLSFRLSLFNLQVLFHYFFHLLMFYYMYHKLSNRTFTFLIFVSAVKMAVNSGWWGGLEVLRSQVRQAHIQHDKEQLNRSIGFWLIFSLLFALPAFLLSIYCCYTTYSHVLYDEPIIESLFLAFIYFSFAIHFPLGAYHSGIYGFSRIMRPRLSMILSYIVGICLIVLTSSRFKAFSILLAFVGESATSSFLTYHYTAKMYDFYKITPLKPTWLEFWQYINKFQIKNFLLGAVSNIFIVCDAILITAFYFAASGDMRQIFYVQIVYLVSPLIRASSDWSRLFYFDRKQLENDQLNLFINQYEKSVLRLAAMLGLFFGLFAAASSYIILSPLAGLYTLMLLPFFLMRSLISNQQVRAFSFFYYYDVIVSGTLMIAGLVSIYISPLTIPMKSILIAVLMIVINAILKRFRFKACNKVKYQSLYTNIYTWLSKIIKCQKSFEVYRITLDKKATSQEKFSFIRRFSQDLEIPGDQICYMANLPILFYREIEDCDHSNISQFLAQIGLGVMQDLERQIIQISTESTPQECINTLRKSTILRDFVAASFYDQASLTAFSLKQQEITSRFIETFPAGIYYNPERHLGPKAEVLADEAVRKFNYLIRQYLFNPKKGRSKDFDLSLLYEEGSVTAIFVIPLQDIKEEDIYRIKHWHEYLHSANIAESLKCSNQEEYAQESISDILERFFARQVPQN